ncbi:DUF3742 family protein [Pantoea agglomerans]|uniref:DUF3742 family protein n=1 Tax=Enterobacter agglomerans TaxID=549 RepID=UPI001F5B7CB8|nr:DUF3742 family protein [Pantoea agglomerans]MCX2202029.1 DUF3742 family protein [Pantoea agglomerans]
MSVNKTAFKRGAKAAAFYKSVSRTAKTLNSASVSWTVRHGMPSFIGRLPVPLIGIILAILVLMCGLVLGTIVLLSCVFIYMLSNIIIASSEDSDTSEPLAGHQYRDGNEGFGMYSGPESANVTSSRLDLDDEDD